MLDTHAHTHAGHTCTYTMFWGQWWSVVECGEMEWNGLEWSPSSKVTMIKSEDHDSGVGVEHYFISKIWQT